VKVVVLGGGVAGLAAALALGREGHRVTLVERDQLDVGAATESWSWDRRGIPHFRQPHAFIPRGRKELRALFPDVHQALLDAGAGVVDLRPKIRGPLRDDDEELAYLAARRPLIEWALRRAVVAEPAIEVLAGVRATGLVGTAARVSGIATSPGPLLADLVVDAMGRRSPLAEWLRVLGGAAAVERATECGIVYYSRYYRVRAGASLPDGPWLPSPRGDLGYALFSSFHGDNGTFAAVLGVPPADAALKVLRHTAAFEAATALMPALHAWTNPDTSEPITDVLPMGSLQNTIRARPPAAGVIAVGDALCHTDPALALGLSFALLHARALAAALRATDDVADAFDAAVRPDIEERFTFAGALDDARARLWAGAPIDVGRRDGGGYALFTVAAGGAAALQDGDVLRRVVRRNTLLESLAGLDGDVAMLERIERLVTELRAAGRAPPGPARDELLVVARAAAARTRPEAP
jgi:2-polyprenyl-6-methoxyphenol hydroxylase-like FAD-dependent oxidoreductase